MRSSSDGGEQGGALGDTVVQRQRRERKRREGESEG
jgi:hypothetical protein